MRNLRMSRMSASAPAGIATRNMGSVVATCTSDTMSGSGLRLVISQPEAALYIQLPTFAMTVAVQITAERRVPEWAKGRTHLCRRRGETRAHFGPAVELSGRCGQP